MGDYSITELEKWNERIERLALSNGLRLYEQEFEIVSYEDMIAYEAYTGMPSHYPHWCYGKAYERLKTLNRYNLSGLPYSDMNSSRSSSGSSGILLRSGAGSSSCRGGSSSGNSLSGFLCLSSSRFF